MFWKLFFNIFKAQDVTEIEKRIDKFLEKNFISNIDINDSLLPFS